MINYLKKNNYLRSILTLYIVPITLSVISNLYKNINTNIAINNKKKVFFFFNSHYLKDFSRLLNTSVH